MFGSQRTSNLPMAHPGKHDEVKVAVVRRSAFLQRSVAVVTQERYNTAVAFFLLWLEEYQWTEKHGDIVEQADLDNAMLDYIIVCFEYNKSRGNRQQCIYLLAGVTLHLGMNFFPLSKRALKVWDKEIPSQSRLPLPWGTALVLARWLYLCRDQRHAYAVTLAFWGYLRPAELFVLTTVDIALLEHVNLTSGTSAPVGVHLVSTKTGKHQFVPITRPIAVKALRWFINNTPKGKPIMLDITYNCLYGVFKEALNYCNLEDFGFGLYSLRHGGAVDAFSTGVDLRFIQEKGRWRSRKTMRTYLQMAKARLVSLQFPENIIELGVGYKQSNPSV